MAEAESITLLQGTKTVNGENAAVKVQQLETPQRTTPPPGDGKGKGGKTTSSPGKKGGGDSKPCRYFASEAGCRMGKACNYVHDMAQVTDAKSRCWNCGSTQHRKAQCPVKDGRSPSKGEPGSGSGGVNPKGASKDGGAVKELGKPQPLVTDGGGGDGPPTSASGTSSSEGKGHNKERDMLSEATQLLKSLRVPMAKAAMYTMTTPGEVLLDSGATHALRPAQSQEEWDQASPVTVSLADGSTERFRMKSPGRTLLARPGQETSWILPLGGIARVGFKVEWMEDECKLLDPRGKRIQVMVRDGCPMISKEEGGKALSALEEYYVNQELKLAMAKVMAKEGECSQREDASLLLMTWMKKVFPDLPDEVVLKTIPDLSGPVNTEELPWNRRRRRRIEKARKVVLHLFSGPDEKEWRIEGAETLCVDVLINPKSDVMRDNTFKYLLSLAASGVVVAVIGGPPCRTTSPCRFKQPGPRPLRDAGNPYRKPELTEREAELVVGDAAMWFRMALVYMVADKSRPTTWKGTLYAVEQPQDPSEYREDGIPYFSMWQTEEWKIFEKVFEMQRTSFDQGRLGHVRRKPTTLGYNFPQLHEVLHEMRGPGVEKVDKWSDEKDLEKKMAESRRWAAWAPGLKLMLRVALKEWCAALESPGKIEIQALRRRCGKIM